MSLNPDSIIKALYRDDKERRARGAPTRLDEVLASEAQKSNEMTALLDLSEEIQIRDFFAKAQRERVAREPDFVD